MENVYMIENYFKLFNIPEAFVVNQTVLKQQFLLLSKKYHPDFFVNEATDDQENALQQIAIINKAYKTLSSKLYTIEYVLEINGILSKDEKYSLPNDFLMEMMELNEKIADAKFEKYSVALQSCKHEIDTLETAIYANVKDYMEAYNQSLNTQKDLLQVKEYFFKKKYLDRMKSNL